MNKEAIVRQYDFNLAYAKLLVHDLTHDQITLVPSIGFENHPAFTLGHLVSGSAMLAKDLGAAMEMQDGWKELFLRNGPGDARMPNPERAKYPSKAELLKELEMQHDKVKNLLKNLNDEDLGKQINWRFSKYMPSVFDLVVFMCITHEAMHLGQLAAWRRAMGLPSALAEL